MKTPFTLLLISSIILFSCQADPDDTLPPATTNDSIYISQLIEIDTLFEPGLDTSQKRVFSYDAAKRLTHFYFGEYFRGVAGADQMDDYYYFYNGNDTLPYKIENTFSTRDGQFRSYKTIFYYYNNQGVITKDSIVSEDENHQLRSTLVSNYIRIADGHYRVEQKYTEGVNVETGYIINRFTSAGGNITSIRDTTYPAHVNQSEGVFVEQLSHDNHPNPLARISLRYPSNEGGNDHTNIQSRNNVTRSDYVWEALGGGWKEAEIIDYQFEYRKDGYPVIRREKTSLEPSCITKYTYTKL